MRGARSAEWAGLGAVTAWALLSGGCGGALPSDDDASDEGRTEAPDRGDADVLPDRGEADDASDRPDSTDGTEAGPDDAAADDGPLGPDGYVLAPAGDFLMGSPEGERGRHDGEVRHPVTLRQAFWIKRTEVTQGEWQTVAGGNPAVFAACGADCPVENITWYQVIGFCNLLSQREGLEACYTDLDDGTAYDFGDADGRKHPGWPAGYDCAGYRLPTEAEWEYAARAGTTTAFFNGEIVDTNCGDPNMDRAGWYCGNSSTDYAGCLTGIVNPAICGGTHPVAGKEANPWGLYDTSGNVWEWTWDFYGDFTPEPAIDPTGGLAPRGYHVAKGGSWDNGAYDGRPAKRDGDDDTIDSDFGPGPHLGFRPCRTRR